MKIMTVKHCIALLLTIGFLNVTTTNAAEINSDPIKNINIAVVDLENVLKNCDAMKDAQKKIGKKQSAFQREIDEAQKKLENENKILDAKKTTLKEEALKKAQDEFSTKIDNLKELVNSRQDSLKQISLDAITSINDQIKEIIDDIKEEKNLDIILSSSSAIFYKDDMDISAEVLKKLNKAISKVKIN
jgi:Skp family chaperone for outer membrane proteins